MCTEYVRHVSCPPPTRPLIKGKLSGRAVLDMVSDHTFEPTLIRCEGWTVPMQDCMVGLDSI